MVKPLTTAKMNSSNITTCGYAGSDMVKAVDKETCTTVTNGTGSTLETIYNGYIKDDFDNDEQNPHVLTYQNLLTKAVNESATNNRMGNSNLKGASSDWKWYPRKLDLMSEMNVYGGIVASSSIYDTGIDNRQYAIFRLKPELINSYGTDRFTYWLKDVVSSTNFARVGNTGISYTNSAGNSGGVRPRFLIG